MMRAYRTVLAPSCIELTVQKSRFIGRCFPFTREEDALAALAQIRKQHYDAAHNCYAYSIGAQGELARFSDDGEPGGTAGLPMMEALRHKGVTDALVVVTRYFGGILLGAGGLVRAYAGAASEAVDAAGIVWMRPCVRYRAEMDYARYGALEPLLRAAGKVEDVRFAERVEATVLVRAEEGGAFLKQVAERTDGRVTPQEETRCYGAFPV